MNDTVLLILGLIFIFPIITVSIWLPFAMEYRERKCNEFYNNMKIGSKWQLQIDENGWPLPNDKKIIFEVVDKYISQTYKHIFKCKTIDTGRIFEYDVYDFNWCKEINN